MGDILNNLTNEELQLLRQKALNKREDRRCLWCDKEHKMRKDQKFCCANCRASYAAFSVQLSHDRLISEKAIWEKERLELLHEISELRKIISSTPPIS